MKDLKDKKILFVTFIVLLLILTTSLSYAYFSTSVKGNDNAKDVVVETGTLKLVYTDSPEIVAEHIKPGWSTTKVVTVKNTGTLDTAYNLVWQELTNEITNDEMIISATCERLNSSNTVDGTCGSIIESPVESNKIKKNISIESGITHKYTFTVTFKEMNTSQDYNQNKKFNGVIGVEEYKKEIPAPTYCTFDGEMVQGAEYTNGQYTYRYMQSLVINEKNNQKNIEWSNFPIEGWGMTLTDKTSEEAVTTVPCTYINDKPVASMQYAFENSKATSIDLSNFNTSNVIGMGGMFFASRATTLDLSNFDTSNVIYMDYMFYASQATTLDLSSFDTKNVTNMYAMFEYSPASRINVSSFNTSNVTAMSYMFSGSQATTLDLSNFNTSKVKYMSGMFEESNVINLNLSSFDTSNVISMSNMFTNSNYLKTIYASDKFNTNLVTSSNDMFTNCTSLVGGSGTTYDSTKVDKSYARIDGGTSNPGYFTAK